MRNAIRIYTLKNKWKSPHAIHVFECLYHFFFILNIAQFYYNFK